MKLSRSFESSVIGTALFLTFLFSVGGIFAIVPSTIALVVVLVVNVLAAFLLLRHTAKERQYLVQLTQAARQVALEHEDLAIPPELPALARQQSV